MCCGSLVGSTATTKATYVVNLFSPLNEQPVFSLNDFMKSAITQSEENMKNQSHFPTAWGRATQIVSVYQQLKLQMHTIYEHPSMFLNAYPRVPSLPQGYQKLTFMLTFTSAANLETTSNLMSLCLYCRRKLKYPENPWKHQVSTGKPLCEQKNRRIPKFTWLYI